MRFGRAKQADSEATEIVVDWMSLADGKPHRLERGVGFSGSTQSFREAAKRASIGLGKSLLLTRDRIEPQKSLWVQFADAQIAEGEPCVCGGRTLVRIGVHLARCRSCGAALVLTQPKEASSDAGEAAASTDAAGEAAPAVSLDDFSEIRLARYAETKAERSYVGFALDPQGSTTLVVVRMPLAGGAPISDPASALGAVYEVVFARSAPAAHLHELGEMPEEAEWDIVLL